MGLATLPRFLLATAAKLSSKLTVCSMLLVRLGTDTLIGFDDAATRSAIASSCDCFLLPEMELVDVPCAPTSSVFRPPARASKMDGSAPLMNERAYKGNKESVSKEETNTTNIIN